LSPDYIGIKEGVLAHVPKSSSGIASRHELVRLQHVPNRLLRNPTVAIIPTNADAIDD
jgi:hypothetical protein